MSSDSAPKPPSISSINPFGGGGPSLQNPVPGITQQGLLNPMNTDPVFNASHGGVSDFLTTGNIGGTLGSLWEGAKSALNLNKPTADPTAPPAPPSLGQTNLQTLGQQLSYEQKLSASNTILTGGGGLLSDQAPQTASETLMGY